jgi:hypothetical protein
VRYTKSIEDLGLGIDASGFIRPWFQIQFKTPRTGAVILSMTVEEV